MPYLYASALSAALVIACILVQYEIMNGLEKASRVLKRHRWIVLLTMCALIVNHIIQMWIYAFGYLLGDRVLEIGWLDRAPDSLIDYAYYSAVVFTTLGFGDMVPHEGLRMLTMSESLAGFCLITWSASFTFLQMQRLWRP